MVGESISEKTELRVLFLRRPALFFQYIRLKQGLFDILEKGGGFAGQGRAVEDSCPRMKQVELFHGPRHGHMEEPPLFFDLIG